VATGMKFDSPSVVKEKCLRASDLPAPGRNGVTFGSESRENTPAPLNYSTNRIFFNLRPTRVSIAAGTGSLWETVRTTVFPI
jgi:hypothetical protein